MASLIYNSYWHDLTRGLIVDGTATFKVMLATSGYTADATAKDSHLVRSSITPEATGGGSTGYTAGGNTVTVVIAKDTTNDRITITLNGTTWTTASGGTLTARHAVWYVNVGTAGTDRLIAVNDFGSDQIASNGGTLTLPASTITLQN